MKGKPFGTSTVEASLNNCLVKRSSREWKVMTEILPSKASMSMACWMDSSAAPSSSFDFDSDSLENLLGRVPFFLSSLAGLADLIISANSVVVSMVSPHALAQSYELSVRKLILTILEKDPNQVMIVIMIDHLIGRQTSFLIHPHIQWRILL